MMVIEKYLEHNSSELNEVLMYDGLYDGLP